MDINNYLGKPVPDMVGDLTAAHSAAQNRMARERGFRDYQQMLDWSRQQQNATGGTIDGASDEGKNLTRRNSAGQMAKDASSWHPAVIFQRIADMMRDARR